MSENQETSEPQEANQEQSPHEGEGSGEGTGKPGTQSEGAGHLNDFLPEEQKGEELILGKFKSQDDLVSAYQALERKQSRGETGLGLESAEAYLDAKNFNVQEVAEQLEVDPAAIDPESPGMQALSRIAKKRGKSREQFNEDLTDLLGLLREEYGFALSEAEQRKAFTDGMKKVLGENYEEVGGQVASYVHSTLKPQLSTDSQATLDSMLTSPQVVLLVKEMMELNEGRRAAVVAPSRSSKSKLDIPNDVDAIQKMLDDPSIKTNLARKAELTEAQHALLAKQG